MRALCSDSYCLAERDSYPLLIQKYEHNLHVTCALHFIMQNAANFTNTFVVSFVVEWCDFSALASCYMSFSCLCLLCFWMPCMTVLCTRKNVRLLSIQDAMFVSTQF